LAGETEVTRRKPTAVPQIPRELTWDWTLAAEMTNNLNCDTAGSDVGKGSQSDVEMGKMRMRLEGPTGIVGSEMGGHSRTGRDFIKFTP
jgi:hypothetical protein